MHPVSRIHSLPVGIEHKDDIVACGLRALLSAQPGLTVCDGACEVLVCDYDKALENAAGARGDAGPAPRILVFTTRHGEQEVRQALSMGVQGYLLADAVQDDIVRGVRALGAGQRYLSPVVADRIAESLAHTPLTPREHEVLGGLGAGQCNKAIARQLGISVATVKAHVSAMMDKMNARNRTQVVSKAVQRGLLAGHRFA
ncbi:MAG: LuxR C-terminal-related transcriptional regulator [Aquincola tertiaricarbonis]